MGAITVSKKEKEQKRVEEEKLRREIWESVRRCAAADREEHRKLFPAGLARRISGGGFPGT